MPQQTSNKKVVASKGGRKISTPVGLLFILVAVLVLAVGGTWGYSKYKARDLKAKAGTWTSISNAGTKKAGIQIRACKVYQPIGSYADDMPGTITFIVSKPKGTKPNFAISLYKKYPIKGGVVPGQTIKETISSKVVNNWQPIKTVSSSTLRNWWGDEVTSFKITSTETITNAKIGLVVPSSTAYKNVGPPFVNSETKGKTTFLRHYYYGYGADASNGLLKTDSAFKAAYKNWVTNYAVSVPRITNCADSY